MASFISLSSPSRFHQIPQLPPLRFNSITSSFTQFKNYGSGRCLLLQVKCVSKQNTDAEESKLETTSSSSPEPPSSSNNGVNRNNSTYDWCAVLGGLGFLETSYLTYLKLTNSEAFCPTGSAGSCTDVLSSDYSMVFGLPLPLIGMVAYGLVTTVGLLLGGKNLPFKISETDGRWILLVTTTSMAVSSAYFLYILNTQFAGQPCFYCLASALLSFSLLFITLKDLGSQEIIKVVGLQLCVASLVFASLNSSYNDILPIARSSTDEIPYFKTEITTQSSPLAISLAKHLHAVGAKLYGAFWCSHCQEQKEMFGREAAEILDYVECFPDGFKKGTTMIKECAVINIQGFPTWVINGEVHSGELEFSELAELTGTKPEDLGQSK